MAWYHVEDRTVTARKRHVCLLCGQYISVGTRYVSRFGFDNEGPLRTCMHVDCEALTSYWDAMDWECHLPGEGEWPTYAEGGE